MLWSVPERAAGAVDEQVVAELTVVVPPDAQVFFDAKPVGQKGGERLLLTRLRQVGKKYRCHVLARWKESDMPAR